jgi:radical SAM superfamily enzyme YgiQ (UPF0313 family)
MNKPQYRPPAEANSLILQVDQGCPYNRCTFCRMYRDVTYERRELSAIADMISQEARRWPDARRIFLADGDVFRRSCSELRSILEMVNANFPRLARVSVYANGSSILTKTAEELSVLRTLKLHTLYMGLESGDDAILKACRKGERAEQMVEAGVHAEAAGLRMSVMVLLGIGGRTNSIAHANETAAALNRMQPRLLSVLRIVPVPGTELYDDIAAGHFDPLTEYGAVEELRRLVEALELTSTVFRSNHSSNIIPLEGRFPRDKPQLLEALDVLLTSGELDRKSPGPQPLWL